MIKIARLPTALAWTLLIFVGLWFIYFATYHSENVAKTAIVNASKIEVINNYLSNVLKNQELILRNQEEKKKILESQQKEIDEIREIVKGSRFTLNNQYKGVKKTQ